jgi:hypothetical protein
MMIAAAVQEIVEIPVLMPSNSSSDGIDNSICVYLCRYRFRLLTVSTCSISVFTLLLFS